MINFTVGPVQTGDEVKKIGGMDTPYFRTDEFSKIMFENERLILEFSDAAPNSRAVFITGSGTASMEMSIMNTLTQNDNVLVVNGGSFGERFSELLSIYEIPHTEIKIESGKALTAAMLSEYDDCGYTAFVVNIHETSTGVLYDIGLINNFCRKNNLFLIVDAISSFMADELSIRKNGIDVMISSSQKALACPPGISILVLSKRALNRVGQSAVKSMYFNLKNALKDSERGQTPFTPAVSILLQINARLKSIEKNGGVKWQVKKTGMLAEYFRKKIDDFPFEIASESLSNAVTPLHPTTASAYNIFVTLKNEYGIWVCPNGGKMKDTLFRVGHIGELSVDDYDKLIEALSDMRERKII